MNRTGNPSLLISPNSVLANALLRSIDILRPACWPHGPRGLSSWSARRSTAHRTAKRADRTKLAHLDEDGATFTAVCFDHGSYQAHIDPEDNHAYLDLATLYRNLVKERTP